MKPNSKSNKKIMKNYNWEFFKAQINQKLSEPETKKIYSQRKIDVEPVFGFMKAILGFTRMSVRGINKVKRELGFVLMALNIRKIAAQRAVHYKIHIKKADFYQIINRNQLFIKKADFYQIINRNQLFTLPKNLMSQAPS
ncbi:putative transposase [Staphylococcus aureus subsp. aureus SA957]|nr:putative transposase [Staphylococcus aureus subsp. aureus SA957]